MRPAVKELVKVLGEIGYRRSPLEAFQSFVRMAACACAVQTREEEYLAEVKRWDPESIQGFGRGFALLVEGMEEQSYRDLLGPIYMELGSKSSQKWGGEFYTPQDVSLAMAKMTLNGLEVPSDRPLEILEPACGGGGMVLCAAEVLVEHRGLSPLNIRATCVDTNRLACDMCYVNLTLWGIPATIVHGNSLSLETWGGWRNLWWGQARGLSLTPFEAVMRKLLVGHDQIAPPMPSRPSEVSEAEQVAIIKAANGQFAMDFGGAA